MLDGLKERGFDLWFESHAAAILGTDFRDPLDDLDAVLRDFRIPMAEIVAGGGGEAPFTQRLRRAFSDRGWQKHIFVVERMIDGRSLESASHEVDHVKRFDGGVLGLEIEWNNKDPFFDRDLENFKRLHADGAVSVGIVVTRGGALQDGLRAAIRRHAAATGLTSHAALRERGLRPTQRQHDEIERRVQNGIAFADAWAAQFADDKFGTATTHWRKLLDRVKRGVGSPCPLALIGLPLATLAEDR